MSLPSSPPIQPEDATTATGLPLWTQFTALVQRTVLLLWSRTYTNVTAGFSEMTTVKWLRVLIIVCAYMLVRRHLIKLGAKRTFENLDKESKRESEEREKERAQLKTAKRLLTPNEFRGQKVVIPDDSSDDEQSAKKGSGTDAGPEWGKRARRRQRQAVKRLIEAEERRLLEQFGDEEDKDIEQYLTK